MKYVSTRGQAPVLEFEDVLLTGLATDGGLYVPEAWPHFTQAELTKLAGKSYGEVAEAVIAPFTGAAFGPEKLRQMVGEAYATFQHPAVTPLKQLDANQWLLELFHGPTLAFKDVAMQLLSRMMDEVLARRDQTVTIVGATSGDTGGAAIEAFRSSERARVFILHPHGRVSDVQRRQMTTVPGKHIHNIALNGTFDDCQNMLKAMFNDQRFRSDVSLAGVNSINWARIVAQIVYYFTSALALGAPARQVSFCVPTGNFGDIFAGYAAKRMGLPIEQLVIACNVNDILDRTLKTGRYEVRGVVPTAAPSMDIQVSSNFERLLFEVHDRDSDAVSRLMASLSQSGAFTLDEGPLEAIRAEFASDRTDENEVAKTLNRTLEQTGELLDPHTAVGYSVARRTASDGGAPMITLATAHPAKFPDAVMKASGVSPALPAHLADLMDRPERFDVLENDLAVVQDHVRRNI